MNTGTFGNRSVFHLDHRGQSFNLPQRQSDTHKSRIPPIKLFIGRIDAGVCIVQGTDHPVQHAVEFLTVSSLGCQSAEGCSLSVPVEAAKGWVIIMVMNRLPDVIKYSQAALACGRGKAPRVISRSADGWGNRGTGKQGKEETEEKGK